MLFRRVITKQLINDFVSSNAPATYQIQPSRNAGMWKPKIKAKPGALGKSYRRIVHFKDEYTVEPLDNTHLAGRDPETGKYNRAYTSNQILQHYQNNFSS